MEVKVRKRRKDSFQKCLVLSNQVTSKPYYEVGFFCAVFLIIIMCDLCILERKTNIYMETDKFIILDCDSCHIPMSVWKEHTMSIDKGHELWMEKRLSKIGEVFYKGKPFFIDKVQRKIPNHLHWHCRPI